MIDASTTCFFEERYNEENHLIITYRLNNKNAKMCVKKQTTAAQQTAKTCAWSWQDISGAPGCSGEASFDGKIQLSLAQAADADNADTATLRQVRQALAWC